MPMLRAVPAIVFSAASTDIAFMSLIFCSARARSCLRVIVPAVLRFGVPEPLSTPAALRSRSAAGGVLRMNVNERSEKTVISTGITLPACDEVFSLYSFTNCIILMP